MRTSIECLCSPQVDPLLEVAEQHGKNGIRGADASIGTSKAETGEQDELWSEAQIAALQVTGLTAGTCSTVWHMMSLALAIAADNPLTKTKTTASLLMRNNRLSCPLARQVLDCTLSSSSVSCRGPISWQRIPQRQTFGTTWRSMCRARAQTTALPVSGLPTPRRRTPRKGQAHMHWQQKATLMTHR